MTISENLSPSELAFCCKKLRPILLQASLLAVQMQQKQRFKVWEKPGQGPCTSVDLAVNAILKQGLKQALPESGWLSEENTDNKARLEAPYVWIVDPIDGTQDFIKGSDEFSISLALVEQKTPIVGAIALPAEKKIILGCPSMGIELWQYHLQDEGILDKGDLEKQDDFSSVILPKVHWKRYPITLSPPQEITQATLLVSRTEINKNRLGRLQQDFNCIATSSIARKLALVATGRGDLVVSTLPKHEWDIAGGVALILCHKNHRIIDLKNFTEHHFNNPETKSYGLAAGPNHLVEQWCDYWKEKGLRTFPKYD